MASRDLHAFASDRIRPARALAFAQLRLCIEPSRTTTVAPRVEHEGGGRERDELRISATRAVESRTSSGGWRIQRKQRDVEVLYRKGDQRERLKESRNFSLD